MYYWICDRGNFHFACFLERPIRQKTYSHSEHGNVFLISFFSFARDVALRKRLQPCEPLFCCGTI